MALNAALKQLIETKLANTHEPQWVLPITEVRQAFRNLWTPAITGEVVSIRCIEVVTIPGLDTPIPFSLVLEKYILPGKAEIIAGVKRTLS